MKSIVIELNVEELQSLGYDPETITQEKLDKLANAIFNDMMYADYISGIENNAEKLGIKKLE
jgi:hypothetical protein